MPNTFGIPFLMKLRDVSSIFVLLSANPVTAKYMYCTCKKRNTCLVALLVELELTNLLPVFFYHFLSLLKMTKFPITCTCTCVSNFHFD